MSGQGEKEDDDLMPSTGDYRVSSKKTLEELQTLDAHDGMPPFASLSPPPA